MSAFPVICLAAGGDLGQLAASQAAAPKASDPQDASLLDLDRAPAAESEIQIHVRVPHTRKLVESFSAYPYPVKPPPFKKPEDLPIKKKDIKDRLLQSGYINRKSLTKSLPAYGWRWEYAYQAALRRSGGNVPVTILGMYPWASRMVEYIYPEIKRLNEAEHNRAVRYFQAMQEYQNNYAEIESEATRRGLYPLDAKMRRSGEGAVKVQDGTWWIVGTRKVPGLTYYWRIPVTVNKGETSSLVLTEANALIIQGGW